MITHLISTTEFVKLLLNTSPYDLPDEVELNPLRVIHNYANFISQKPELWMFVPCDEEGNVLEEPKINGRYGNSDSSLYDGDIMEYEDAQSKVLFKGWEYKNNALRCNNKHVIHMYDFEDYYTLERLQYDKGILELTETALKQIL